MRRCAPWWLLPSSPSLHSLHLSFRSTTSLLLSSPSSSTSSPPPASSSLVVVRPRLLPAKVKQTLVLGKR